MDLHTPKLLVIGDINEISINHPLDERSCMKSVSDAQWQVALGSTLASSDAETLSVAPELP